MSITVALVSLTGNALITAVKERITASHAAAKDAARERADELTTLRTLGVLLFEVRANLERVRFLVQMEQEKKIAFGVFDLSFSDSLMPELARQLPQPVYTAAISNILGAIRRTNHYQTIGQFRLAQAFASDAHRKEIFDLFNHVLRCAHEFGEALLGEEWAAIRGTTLPNPINEAAGIDHAII